MSTTNVNHQTLRMATNERRLIYQITCTFTHAVHLSFAHDALAHSFLALETDTRN
ncbi:hypothetical protein CPC08DRAFT_709078 [Agrocybe pediades]|nr:hypothetical protein CPC08DRAFT_709078 [Agrocybe pediades]